MRSPPSSQLDRHELKHLADLARLDPHAEQGERLERELREILSYMETLDESSPGEAPGPTAPSCSPVLRRDEPRPSLPRERAMASAPERAGGFFCVRRVIG
jgi:aspartyl-tRNA(Asn)/glutamyl-tRNA(Gln) amidotransferase subunit C